MTSIQFPDSITHAQLKDLLKAGRQKRAAIVYEPFTYGDVDTVENEINEIYSFEERYGFNSCAEQFLLLFPRESWRSSTDKVKREFVMSRLDTLETSQSDSLKVSAAALLFIAQGTPTECKTKEEHLQLLNRNCHLLRKFGALQSVLVALHQAWPSGQDWKLVSIYLQILALIMITSQDDPKLGEDLGHPTQIGHSAVVLFFDMLNSIADGRIPRGFPLKKTLLCLRLSLLICWGNTAVQAQLKEAVRAKAGLPPVKPGIYTKHTMDDLESFERETASRYFGFNPVKSSARTLSDLEESLPVPIREGLDTLRANIFVSLGEVQLKLFLKERLPNYPWSPSSIKQPENEEAMTQRVQDIAKDLAVLIPSMPRHVVTLLKLLLASVPSVKKTQGSLSLLNDLEMLPYDLKNNDITIEQSAQQIVDSARHREILSKSIGAIIILLLKHSRIVHILHFELICQLLVENNGLLLLLRYLNQDLGLYISSKNDVTPFTFLSYATEPREQLAEHEFAQAGKSEAEINAIDTFDSSNPIFVCWRNAYGTATLLRILQKLTKRKLGRIRTLMEYKAPAILKRVTKLPYDGVAFYALKVVKSQLPYLGRKWRSSNMKMVSAIYMELRSRAQDAALLSASSDLEGEELPPFGTDEIHHIVDDFIRTIGLSGLPSTTMDEDDELATTSLRHIELGLGFVQNYETWLENEVYNDDDGDDDDDAIRPPSPA